MVIRQIADLLSAQVLCGDDKLDGVVNSACGCDMMSDVLAFVKDQAVLLTGIFNLQVIRTAEMMDMLCIDFVRSKRPTPEMVEAARESGITLLATGKRMYDACGTLYSNGLTGTKI